MRSFRSILPILALACAASTARAETMGRPDSTAPRPLFTRGDAWFAAATLASVALATRLDRWAAEEAPENNGSLAVGASHAGERLGNPEYAIPAFLVLRAIDALDHRSDRAASLVRIAEGAVAASAAVSVVKIAVGRARPYQTPGDQDVVRPFSGNSSFPSGHTALAFGIASAIDRETKARWVPFVVYPLAGLVGWSRLRDGEHWSSDVVAGAALGFWTARKAVDFARRRMHTP